MKTTTTIIHNCEKAAKPCVKHYYGDELRRRTTWQLHVWYVRLLLATLPGGQVDLQQLTERNNGIHKLQQRQTRCGNWKLITKFRSTSCTLVTRRQ